ncbi:3-carboxy-cis,cis-mucoante lactonizing enzyme [Piedraia hortae CBS 480.64]|uniref:3-carboxy-cis,cis-mucoante lactonizing enzyme n=1 Tax=Piedraia hortae CBS 480.64 TaxID=1314780 RepID=A0A6A7C8Z1_9PEZI|nr:3-carboxy-cis,cis-mucoante lactonizing enzyme [Piedraia hortae CBS 480.64]
MKYNLIVGTWTPPGALFIFTFDSVTHRLTLLKRTPIPHDEPISWLTPSHNRKNLYGAGMKKWGSYTINNTTITHDVSLPLTGDPRAARSETKTRAIFCLAGRKSPYYVYCNPFYDHAGYINVQRVTPSGTLDRTIQDVRLEEKSAVHGMVFDEGEGYLYSADMWANRIWTHRKLPNGELEYVDSTPAPDPNDHPRWVSISRGDRFLFVLMEAGNRLCVYRLSSHKPGYTGEAYDLVPKGYNTTYPGMFRSDVCVVSPSGKYLFATARSNDKNFSGYLSVFELGDKGIERRVVMTPTSTSGGHSNAVAPCPWEEEFVALTDDERGFVEVYRFNAMELGRVARVEVNEPGFGMNAVWVEGESRGLL